MPRALIQPLLWEDLARSDIFLETPLPRLFLMRSALRRPEAVRKNLPAKTRRFAKRGDIFSIAFFSIAVIAFLAFMAFVAVMVEAIEKEC